MTIVNVNNIDSLTMEELDAAMHSYWNVSIPKADEPGFLSKIQPNLSVLPSTFIYVNRLLSAVSAQCRGIKAMDSKDIRIPLIMSKKEYLENLAESLKLAYDASSRMVTIAQMEKDTSDRIKW